MLQPTCTEGCMACGFKARGLCLWIQGPLYALFRLFAVKVPLQTYGSLLVLRYSCGLGRTGTGIIFSVTCAAPSAAAGTRGARYWGPRGVGTLVELALSLC